MGGVAVQRSVVRFVDGAVIGVHLRTAPALAAALRVRMRTSAAARHAAPFDAPRRHRPIGIVGDHRVQLVGVEFQLVVVYGRAAAARRTVLDRVERGGPTSRLRHI